MDELVRRLAHGTHPVTVGGPRPSLAELRWRIEEHGFVFVRFTQTRGGSDLGMLLDRVASDVDSADFARAVGVVHLEGTLVLNDVPVRCVADIDLATLSGAGHLAAPQSMC